MRAPFRGSLRSSKAPAPAPSRGSQNILFTSAGLSGGGTHAAIDDIASGLQLLERVVLGLGELTVIKVQTLLVLLLLDSANVQQVASVLILLVGELRGHSDSLHASALVGLVGIAVEGIGDISHLFDSSFVDTRVTK